MLEEFDMPDDRSEMYRGYRLTYTDPYGHIIVSVPGGGGIPNDLQGSWTSMGQVMKKIDWYLGMQKEGANKPPLDKNTRKVQEIMAERTAAEDNKITPSVIKPDKDIFKEAKEDKVRYVENPKVKKDK